MTTNGLWPTRGARWQDSADLGANTLLIMGILRVALAQIDGCVGDLGGNKAKILDRISAARSSGAHIVVFPELAVTGYPPEDLLFRLQFIADNIAALNEIAAATQGICAIVGFADSQHLRGTCEGYEESATCSLHPSSGGGVYSPDVGRQLRSAGGIYGDGMVTPPSEGRWRERDRLYNAAAALWDGKIAGIYRKHLLPNYGVFDEARYFARGETNCLFQLGGVPFGVSVCEDIWFPDGPAKDQAAAGARVLINISASPYHRGKGIERERMIADRATSYGAFMVYCNAVGGQDELVFDGHSIVCGPTGDLIARGKQFEEDLIVVDLDLSQIAHDPQGRVDLMACVDLEGSLTTPTQPTSPSVHPVMEDLDEVWSALVLGMRDYVRKNGFARVALGLSGGIDSAIVACIAADALGPENVTCVFMPSPYSSDASRDDAATLARNLGVDYRVIPISETFAAYRNILAEAFVGRTEDITEENLQARIRGNILMALSNKFGGLVLTTGNKSEMACGYATLYGDMAGGFAVLKDVPKTLVYKLARRLNERGGRDVIPDRIITRAPTAELKPNQTDQDTLPPYDVLDAILDAYIDDDMAPKDIAAMGYDLDTALRVIRMVDQSEYKRRQAPPGVKITTRAFGRDRRLPITNKYRG